MLFAKYNVYANPYADDNIYYSAEGYWEHTVIPHKIAVYNSGLKLLQCMSNLDNYYFDKKAFIKRLIEHDLSKFSAIETLGYMNHKFGSENSDYQKKIFNLAWHHHKQNNSHHPEYWFNSNKKGETELIAMRRLDVLEMVADWLGAGQSYSTPFEEWAKSNLSKFSFHPETQQELSIIFKAIGFQYEFTD